MRFAILAISLSLAVSFYRCSDNGPSQADSFGPGSYEYTAFDANGKKVVTGHLKLVEVKGDALKGTWELKKTGDAANLGPQEGSGEFVGSLEQDRIELNLNPFHADNNVFLSGRWDQGQLKGTWSFSGFAGPITKGTFVAKKK